MLTTSTLMADLQRRLGAVGFDAAQPDLKVFWGAWSQQASEPVDGKGLPGQIETDKLLFETSLNLRVPPAWEYEAPGPAFTVSFTRQFINEDGDGEYEGMEGLHASFQFAPDSDFEQVVAMDAGGERGYGATLWGWPADHAAKWITKVEAHPTFIAAAAKVPTTYELGQGPY